MELAVPEREVLGLESSLLPVESELTSWMELAVPEGEVLGLELALLPIEPELTSWMKLAVLVGDIGLELASVTVDLSIFDDLEYPNFEFAFTEGGLNSTQMFPGSAHSNIG